MIDLLFAVGTRPNLIKLKPLVDAAKQVGLTFAVYDTYQHYNDEMCWSFYSELSLPTPVSIITKEYKAVVVIGDTDSTVESALTATRLGMPVAHIEAGCRCGKNIPEEINRKAVDAVATWNFAPTPNAFYNVNHLNGHLTGDVLYDLFLQCRPKPYVVKDVALITIHRQENTESDTQVYKILCDCSDSHELLLFPVHPRLRDMKTFPPRVLPIRPLTYRKTLYLLSRVVHVYTDSGGVQREAYWTGVPFTLLRNETEWPETLSPGNESEFGDGHAADKIMKVLSEEI